MGIHVFCLKIMVSRTKFGTWAMAMGAMAHVSNKMLQGIIAMRHAMLACRKLLRLLRFACACMMCRETTEILWCKKSKRRRFEIRMHVCMYVVLHECMHES